MSRSAPALVLAIAMLIAAVAPNPRAATVRSTPVAASPPAPRSPDPTAVRSSVGVSVVHGTLSPEAARSMGGGRSLQVGEPSEDDLRFFTAQKGPDDSVNDSTFEQWSEARRHPHVSPRTRRT